MIFGRITIILLAVVLFFSCKENEKTKTAVMKWVGKEVVMPNDSLLRNKVWTKINPHTKKLKIFVPVNGNCSACAGQLKKWEAFMEEIDTTAVGFVYLIYSYDNLIDFESFNNSIIDFKYPYFQDDDRKVMIENGLFENEEYQIFLLDENNKVVLVGDPTNNEAIRTLYFREIDARL